MTAVRVARVQPHPARSSARPLPHPRHRARYDAATGSCPSGCPGANGVRISAISSGSPEDENAGAIQGAGAKPSTAEELSRLLHAAGARMTSVDIDELGPGVPVAQIGLTGPASSGNVQHGCLTAWASPSRRARRSGWPTR